MGHTETGTFEARKVRLLHQAEQDIKHIEEFIAITNGRPLHASKVSMAIYHTIDRIALFPFAFKECEQLATESKMFRQVACLSFVIIYQITETEVCILGIIHSARRPSAKRKLIKRK